MIKFFRKTRQRLLTENKFSNYLIYALGEIILVVLGILIALQINNWNENRKIKNKEIETLKEIRSDLIQNIDDIDVNIKSLIVSKEANEIIIDHIENSLPYNDSLRYYFANLYPYIVFTMNQTTYDNLKQIGLNLISNDSLKNNISDLYANQYSSYRMFEKTYLVEHHNNYIKPIYMAEFNSFEVKSSLQLINYEQFLTHKQYKQVMNYSVSMFATFIRIQSNLKVSIEELIIEINKELEK